MDVSDLADEIERRVNAVRDSLLKVGTVSGTSGQKVICTVEGTSMTLARLTSYTPVNGDTVLILAVKPNSWFVVGKPAV